MSETSTNYNDLFEQAVSFPDSGYKSRLDSLVGLDDYIERSSKILGLLINSKGLEDWAKKHHKDAFNTISRVLKRPPLLIFEGDVGTGKSELAFTIGDLVARKEDIDITLFPISLSTRGEGKVGQMTKLITAAFEHTANAAKKLKSSGKSRGAVILLIDEADSLAQSRESTQMHHEDRAGVNAFIRGIDRIANEELPAAVIMCTNRVSSLDPAVKRRAADILTFERPNEIQRLHAIETPLTELGLSKSEIKKIVDLTGPKNNVAYGFTYSDLLQRLIPSIVLDAYPDKSVTGASAIAIANQINPTPPFNEQR